MENTTESMVLFDAKAFGKQLKKARKAKDLTQEELGAMVGMGQSTYHKYEKGEIVNKPNIETMIKFAQALGVTVDSLCGLTEIAQTQESTPVQWLSFLDKLLDKDYIILDADEDIEPPYPVFYSISFFDEKISQFFKSYKALRILKNEMSPSDYQLLANNLFERYAHLFGVNDPNDPIHKTIQEQIEKYLPDKVFNES